ncbi:glycoside hydrolase family 18 [uncultured Muribaculum sp.]|uniref:glycoside hydrolase family 18 n=1 Tax=uncultured Muribaculum sp. TaxID=1918613 RepID=UPI0025CDEFFE|nr:glycoside hydrolase family 18 [uncultured Muribaculum sp.]
MNKLLKYGIPAILSAAALTACDDWTDTESVDLNYPTVEETSPELYARYLENLRAYKGRSHKQVYAWFRNNATPDNRSTHVTVLPDSIDAVVVLNPQSVADFVYADMAETREKKATKFLYTVDFDAIKNAYNAKVEAAPAEEPVTTAFRDFLVDSMAVALSYSKHYDGLCIAYTGKPKSGMKPAELTDYEANERLFTGVLADWHRRNPAKRIDFTGKPQNLADKTLLEECNMIFLSTSLDVTEEYAFNTVLADARAEGVPLDRLGMMGATASLDKEDTKTGILNDGTPSLTALAAWAPYAEVGGVGVYNVERDYFNPSFVFPRTRALIHSVNPNVK